jgi:hypothetical protein
MLGSVVFSAARKRLSIMVGILYRCESETQDNTHVSEWMIESIWLQELIIHFGTDILLVKE